MSDTRARNLALVAGGLAVVFMLVAGMIATAWRSVVVWTSTIPLALSLLFSLLACWHAVLVRRQQEEREDQDRIRREYDRDDLFGDQKEALQLAATAHRQFVRYIVPACAFLIGIVLIITCLLLWQYWSRVTLFPVADPLPAAALGAFLMVFALLVGSYFSGVSRAPASRWLRPVGAWFMAAAGIAFAAMAVMLARHFQVGDPQANYDLLVGKWVLALLLVFGAEMIISQVLEFYRPRLRGELERPVYESRMLSFFTEPGGIARNVAHALDYQFGFKVSDTWFYRFLEKAVTPFLLLTVVLLYFLDCFVMVEAHQVGLRETYWFGGYLGRTVIAPGLHLKLPWPLQDVRKFDTGRVQRMVIGFEEGGAETPRPGPDMDPMAGDPTGRILVWGKKHFKSESSFLLPSAPGDQDAGAAAPLPDQPSFALPVNLMNANFSIYYRVGEQPEQVKAYAYHYRKPDDVLKSLAQRELVNALATADFLHLIGPGLEETRGKLTESIRQVVAAADPPLGIEVEFVALCNVHPPPEVAQSFQDVVAAREERYTRQLTAEKEAIRVTNEARGEAQRIKAAATAYGTEREKIAEGEKIRFQEQCKAFIKAPAVFKARTYLDVLEQLLAGKRKFFIAGQGKKVGILNLEEPRRKDILDVDTMKPEN